MCFIYQLLQSPSYLDALTERCGNRIPSRRSSGGLLHATAAAADADVPMVTERRRKSRPRLPVNDDEGSDGAHVDEEPLAGSRVRTGLANVSTRRRSAVVVTTTSRRSLIEDDEGRCSCIYIYISLPNYDDATLSNQRLVPALSRVLTRFLTQF